MQNISKIYAAGPDNLRNNVGLFKDTIHETFF